jgi:dihydropteroate synthase
MTAHDFNSWLINENRAPLVMGVLNVTPDSFSDGGRYSTHDAAIAHAEEMSDAGADMIDIGGESTRPGSDPVDDDEQIRRVIPVIANIAARLPVVLSIDTTRAKVAQAALDAGANLVNDISAGLDDSAMFSLVARRRVPIILMHMLGQPRTMQLAPSYDDVTAEVSGFLNERIIVAASAGIDLEKILIDPGIGFGKALHHNLELLRRIGELTVLGRPMVVGTSRKSFIGKITGETEPSHRLFGTAASISWCIANGAAIVRVHDVEPMTKVVKMIRAILGN